MCMDRYMYAYLDMDDDIYIMMIWMTVCMTMGMMMR